MAKSSINHSELIRLWNKGLYAKEIAERLNCPIDTVYKIAHRKGLTKRKSGMKPFIADKDKVKNLSKLYPDMSNETCSLILGYSPDHIGNMARKLNLKKSKYYLDELKEYHKKKVREYHQQNKKTK